MSGAVLLLLAACAWGAGVPVPPIADPVLVARRAELAEAGLAMRQGIHADEASGARYYTGRADGALGGWELYSEALVQIGMGWPSEHIRGGVRLALARLREQDDRIPRHVGGKADDRGHFAPFLCQTLALVRTAYGEPDGITEPDYRRLQRYLERWLDAEDTDRDGLAEWPGATGREAAVELNCWLVRELRALAPIARQCGQSDEADAAMARADTLAERIRVRLWDEREGFFHDREVATDRLLPARTIAGFAPLWALVASPAQATRMVEGPLFDPAGFWTPAPVAALARSEGGWRDDPRPGDGRDWQTGVWMPANHQLIHGLRFYGYRAIATLVAQRSFELVERSGCHAWYDADTGAGRGAAMPAGGWSLLGRFLIAEERLAVDLTDLR